jgi:hypothetical protein
MANTHDLIQTITVGSGGASSFDFTSIPQTYTDLKVLISGRVASAVAGLDLISEFNGVTTGYSRKLIYTNDYVTIYGYTDTARSFGFVPGANHTANVFGITELYIPNYTGSNNKVLSGLTHTENNGTPATFEIGGITWNNTAAITRFTIGLPSSNFVQHSSASLYGIKNS